MKRTDKGSFGPFLLGTHRCVHGVVMLFVVAGIAIGMMISVGPLRFLATPVDYVVSLLTAATESLVSDVVAWVASSQSEAPVDVSSASRLLGILAALATPALVALVLVLVAEGSDKARHFGGTLLVVGALASFLALPPSQAFVLVLVALALNAFFSFASGLLLRLPCWALATVVSVSVMTAARSGDVKGLDAAVSELSSSIPASPGVLRLLLVAVSVTPVLVGAGLGLNAVDGKGK